METDFIIGKCRVVDPNIMRLQSSAWRYKSLILIIVNSFADFTPLECYFSICPA
jgi:hypothetical protein